VSRCS